jgi:hypothetical protein
MRSRHLIRTIFLLALGVTAHDIASILGFHIPGLHALYFSIPLMLICLVLLTGLHHWGEKQGF